MSYIEQKRSYKVELIVPITYKKSQATSGKISIDGAVVSREKPKQNAVFSIELTTKTKAVVSADTEKLALALIKKSGQKFISQPEISSPPVFKGFRGENSLMTDSSKLDEDFQKKSIGLANEYLDSFDHDDLLQLTNGYPGESITVKFEDYNEEQIENFKHDSFNIELRQIVEKEQKSELLVHYDGGKKQADGTITLHGLRLPSEKGPHREIYAQYKDNLTEIHTIDSDGQKANSVNSTRSVLQFVKSEKGGGEPSTLSKTTLDEISALAEKRPERINLSRISENVIATVLVAMPSHRNIFEGSSVERPPVLSNPVEININKVAEKIVESLLDKKTKPQYPGNELSRTISNIPRKKKVSKPAPEQTLNNDIAEQEEKISIENKLSINTAEDKIKISTASKEESKNKAKKEADAEAKKAQVIKDEQEKQNAIKLKKEAENKEAIANKEKVVIEESKSEKSTGLSSEEAEMAKPDSSGIKEDEKSYKINENEYIKARLEFENYSKLSMLATLDKPAFMKKNSARIISYVMSSELHPQDALLQLNSIVKNEKANFSISGSEISISGKEALHIKSKSIEMLNEFTKVKEKSNSTIAKLIISKAKKTPYAKELSNFDGIRIDLLISHLEEKIVERAIKIDSSYGDGDVSSIDRMININERAAKVIENTMVLYQESLKKINSNNDSDLKSASGLDY
jgi:hypothetical protein